MLRAVNRALLLASLLFALPAVADEEPAEPPGISTPVLALWITGGVGVTVGVTFGIKALVHQSRATDVDYVGGQRQIEATRTSQRIANIGYGVGFASLAAGLILQQLFPDLDAVLFSSTASSVALGVRF